MTIRLVLNIFTSAMEDAQQSQKLEFLNCDKMRSRLKNDQNHGGFSAAGWYEPILATQICRDSYTVERATFNAIEHVPPKTQHNDSKIFSLARPHYTLDIDEILIKNSLKLMVPQHAYSFNITKFH